MFKTYIPIFILVLSINLQALFIWSNDSLNQRPYINIHPALMAAAQWKAEYLSTHKFAHCTEYNECPNKTIKLFGCNNNYNENDNSVESLIKGISNPEIAYNYLINNSPSHRRHLLAETQFFKEQIDIGVGYINNIFVFISAKCID